MKSSELERIAHLAAIFGAAAPRGTAGVKGADVYAAGDAAVTAGMESGAGDAGSTHGVLLGIGDDAAVLAPCAEPLVWTVDAAVEGTHFRREWLSFEDIGYRSTMAAASDLAAMGAAPLGVLCALVLPDDVGDDEMAAIARGQHEAVTVLGTTVVGGNLARGRELSITTTVLGHAPSPLQRRGARPGDALWLIGPVGLAAAGLRFLMEAHPVDHEVAAACLAAWRRPIARLASALAICKTALAAIDISDGLARDVAHLARASGARAVIHTPTLPTPTLHAAASRLGVDATHLALFGGEDYALAVAAPSNAVIQGGMKIGWFEELRAGEPAVVALGSDGTRQDLPESGFDHFARDARVLASAR